MTLFIDRIAEVAVVSTERELPFAMLYINHNFNRICNEMKKNMTWLLIPCTKPSIV